MLYFDTSFLAPLILPEATSEAISAFVRELPAAQFTVSHWTRVEFSSLLARQVRMGEMASEAATQADARFEAMIEDSFTVILPNLNDYTIAKAYLGEFASGLRAGDALHLAISKNHGADLVYSLDKTLVKAGRGLGLTTSMGVRDA